jgi:hypothetical protein
MGTVSTLTVPTRSKFRKLNRPHRVVPFAATRPGPRNVYAPLPMRARILWMTIGFLSLGGCGGRYARNKVVQTAAFEHKCAVERVRIVQENTDIVAYVLDVCGTERRYRDMGNEKQLQFVEVTEPPSVAPNATPAPTRDSAPAVPAAASTQPTNP